MDRNRSVLSETTRTLGERQFEVVKSRFSVIVSSEALSVFEKFDGEFTWHEGAHRRSQKKMIMRGIAESRLVVRTEERAIFWDMN